MDMLEIGGLIKTTLIDYPGEVASVLFTNGCNLNCPFCHNHALLESSSPVLSTSVIRSHLRTRAGLCDAVVISGGEPTIQPGLERAIMEIRSLGYKVKLDTNGTQPEILRHLMEAGLVDYIAMDVKSSAALHCAVTGGTVSDRAEIDKSIRLLLEAECNYEFRTTVVMPWHDYDELKSIGLQLKASKRWVLQSYRPLTDSNGTPLINIMSAPPKGRLETWKTRLEQELGLYQIELRTGY